MHDVVCFLGKTVCYAVSLGYILIGASYLILRKKLERNLEYEEVMKQRKERHKKPKNKK